MASMIGLLSDLRPVVSPGSGMALPGLSLHSGAGTNSGNGFTDKFAKTFESATGDAPVSVCFQG